MYQTIYKSLKKNIYQIYKYLEKFIQQLLKTIKN